MKLFISHNFVLFYFLLVLGLCDIFRLFVCCGGIAKRFWFESGKFCDRNPFLANSFLAFSSPPGKSTCVCCNSENDDEDKKNLKAMFFIWLVMSSKLFHSNEAGKIPPLSRSTATPLKLKIFFVV